MAHLAGFWAIIQQPQITCTQPEFSIGKCRQRLGKGRLTVRLFPDQPDRANLFFGPTFDLDFFRATLQAS